MISTGPTEDRLAIRELVESYNDAVMRFDADAWGSNWAPDGVWSLPGRGEVSGREAIVGEYTDDYVRADGRWYFAKRVYKVRTAH